MRLMHYLNLILSLFLKLRLYAELIFIHLYVVTNHYSCWLNEQFYRHIHIRRFLMQITDSVNIH